MSFCIKLRHVLKKLNFGFILIFPEKRIHGDRWLNVEGLKDVKAISTGAAGVWAVDKNGEVYVRATTWRKVCK